MDYEVGGRKVRAWKAFEYFYRPLAARPTRSGEAYGTLHSPYIRSLVVASDDARFKRLKTYTPDPSIKVQKILQI